ncbi:MAG: glycosyltransferase family A protein, partial [bacterium]|nr:glycosyltransferase family A protein [bacterium]
TNTKQRTTKRRIGGQAVIHLGIQHINFEDYDFIIRMDGDVVFEPDFFERMFQKLDENPKLGIASGVCFVEVDGNFIEEKNPKFHTRGPLKIYKSKCIHDIGGLIEEEGWDTIDEVKANMLGWVTQNFDELRVIHLRRTQSASGALRGYLNQGHVAYYIGYHPMYMLLRAVRKMFNRPFIVGGVYLYAGYLQGFIKRAPRFEDKKITNYMREQQINKILGKESIWK